jgi:hypothetical protein
MTPYEMLDFGGLYIDFCCASKCLSCCGIYCSAGSHSYYATQRMVYVEVLEPKG